MSSRSELPWAQPPLLLGSPCDTFKVRFNSMMMNGHSVAAELIWMVLVLGVWFRMPELFAATRTLGVSLLVMVSISWTWRRWTLSMVCQPGAGLAHPASYARWREAFLTASLVALTLLVGNQACGSSLRFLNMDRSGSVFAASNVAERPLLAAVRHGVVLLVASHVGAYLLAWAAWQARLPWAVALAAAVVTVQAAHDPSMCASAELASPAAQRMTAAVYGALDLLSLALPYPAACIRWSNFSRPTPAEQCTSVLLFLQLSLSFFVPLLFQAAQEVRRWRHHQQQRACAGLLPESGWQARLYEGLGAVLCPEGERLRSLLPGRDFLLLAIMLWQLTLLGVPHLPALEAYFV